MLKNSPFSYTKLITGMLSAGLFTALSYTSNFDTFALTKFAGQEAQNEGSDLPLDATIDVFTVVGITVGVIVAGASAISILASRYRGELASKEKAIEQGDTSIKESDLDQYRKKIIQSLHNGLLVSTSLLPIAMVPMYFSEYVLVNILKENPQIARLAQIILRIYSRAVPGIVTRTSIEQIMFAFECSKSAMGISLASFAIGTLVSTALFYGWGDLPKLGLEGVAYGYMVEAYLACFSYGGFLAFHPTFKKYNFFKPNFNANLAELKKLLNIWIPNTFTNSIEILAGFISNTFTAHLGIDQLTAQSFASQLVSLQFVLIMAVGQTTSLNFSTAAGAKNYELMQRIVKVGTAISMAITAIPATIFSIKPEWWSTIIKGNSSLSNDVSQYLTSLMPATSVGLILDSYRFNRLQLLICAGDEKISNILMGISTWLSVGLAYAIGFHTELGVTGLAAGYAGGIFAGAVMLMLRSIVVLDKDTLQKADLKSVLQELDQAIELLSESKRIIEHEIALTGAELNTAINNIVEFKKQHKSLLPYFERTDLEKDFYEIISKCKLKLAELENTLYELTPQLQSQITQLTTKLNIIENDLSNNQQKRHRINEKFSSIKDKSFSAKCRATFFCAKKATAIDETTPLLTEEGSTINDNFGEIRKVNSAHTPLPPRFGLKG